MTLCSMEEGIKDLQAGKMLIVVDDENRENEGDLLMAAEFVNSTAVNFMVTHARGLVCIPMEGARLDELNLPLMSNPDVWDGPAATAFTVSVDHKVNTETGISAQDRAATVKALIDSDTVSTDFIKPGHLFPL